MTTETSSQDATVQTAPQQPEVKKRLPVISIIQLLLFIGLIVLYALFFLNKDRKSVQQESLVALKDSIEGAKSSIAYIRSEVLLADYALAIKMRADFEAEQTQMENDLSRRQRTFQNEVESFQRGISNSTIGMEQAQIKEQELMAKQQELIQLNDTYRERLARKEYEMNLELLEKISEFLERYNQETAYDYILGYTPGGGILYADEQHDITAHVLERLNAEYNLPK
jgi:outer membrane protein